MNAVSSLGKFRIRFKDLLCRWSYDDRQQSPKRSKSDPLVGTEFDNLLIGRTRGSLIHPLVPCPIVADFPHLKSSHRGIEIVALKQVFPVTGCV